jgi:ribosomal-protein-alanine N-acetyltransferase
VAAEIAPLDLSPFFEQHLVLETERLVIRPITLTDAEDVFAYASDPEVTKYMTFLTHASLADSIKWLMTVPKEFDRRERMTFAMTLKSDGTFIGSSGFHDISSEHHRLMMGYVLNRKYWDKGYMTEAVREMIRFAFEEMSMHRVAANCDLENVRSARVMERCGMKLEGTLRDYEIRHGTFVSTKTYAIINGN